MLGPSAREVVHEFASRMAAHTRSGVVRLVQKRRQMLSQHLVEDVFARLWTGRGHERRALQRTSVHDRYYGMEQEVFARIEAGGGSGPDLPDLRDRILELFKVVSREGQPEIWLMGQRLLPPLAK